MYKPILTINGHSCICNAVPTYEPGQSICYRIACAPIENGDQPVNSCSLIRVFAEHSVGNEVSKASSDGQRTCAGWSFARCTCFLSIYLSTSIRPSISWWPPSSAEHRNGNPRVSGSSSGIFLTLWHLVADVADWEIRRISTTEGKLWQRRPDSSAEHRNSNQKAPRYCCTFCSHSYIWWPEWIQAPSWSLKEYENKPAWRRLRDSGWIRRNVTVTTGYFSR